MAETKLRKAGEEQLTPVEIETLRARFAAESQQAVTISALAEASGMDRETVREHLRQIRTEHAFRREAKPAPSTERPHWYWAAVGMAVLVVAGGITFQRLKAVQPVEYPIGSLVPGPGAATNTGMNRSRPLEGMLPNHSDGQNGLLPMGVRAVVSIPGRQQSTNGPYSFGKLVPGPYESQRDMVARAIEDLARAAYAGAIESPPMEKDLKPPYRDVLENRFTIGAGEFHYGIESWAGRAEGILKYPIGAAERAQIRKAVEGMFADERMAQEKALAAPMGKGIVSPPPGYRIQFGGRRLDTQEGPPLAFAPVPVGQVQARLEAALANAVVRDRGTPEGRWTQNAQNERKIPDPKRYAGSIEGPGGPVPFDIPAQPAAARERGIREAAARAAAQIESINARLRTVLQTSEGNGTIRN